MSLIRGAIEEGFTHARDFLSGITILSDKLADTIDKTYQLTQGYLTEFRYALLRSAEMEPSPETQETGVEL